ncbi:MAG TPA: glycosyl transferase, partial [Hyphomonas sp.]|nr:glycosyl transferase [Hyphomonas sp.]
PAWSAYWAAKAMDVPFVTTYHGAYSGKTKLKKRYNSVMAQGDIVIANSNWIAEHVKTEHGVPFERVVTIPRGVDLEAFDPTNVPVARVKAIREALGLADDPRKILLLPGRLTEWKGQLIAIEALAMLASDERDKLVLVLAGD